MTKELVAGREQSQAAGSLGGIRGAGLPAWLFR